MSTTDNTTKSWAQIKNHALELVPQDDIYIKRLKFELSEIEKQGATALWENYYNNNLRFDQNPNSLLLPWLLGMTIDDANVDPIKNRKTPLLNTIRASKVNDYKIKNGSIPPDFIKDPDMPDIDLDCLPDARDPIKKYAMQKYGGNIDDGYGPVCSVGTWQTYKFRSAIIDVCAATGIIEKNEAYALTTSLPDEVDDLKDGGYSSCKGTIVNRNTGEEKECGTKHAKKKCPVCGSTDTEGPTLAKLIEDHENLREFAIKYPKVIAYSARIIGRIRNMGMHAGALIISDRSLFGNIPLAKSSNKDYWISMWSEGRNTQLSKFGYVKFDILGLKTLKYIHTCCQLIYENRGIRFGSNGTKDSPAMDGWDDIDPEIGRAGHFFDQHGNKHYIDINDKHALNLADTQKVDGVFQFDTNTAKSILINGVNDFKDLLIFNAMGHPGPMQCCWSYSKINTDDGLVAIKDLDNTKHAVKAWSNQHNVIYTNNYKVVKSGVKKLLKITLKNGKQIIVTPEHKVSTNKGYVVAGELSIGQNVTVCE